MIYPLKYCLNMTKKEIEFFNNGYIYIPYVPLQITHLFKKMIVICA